MEPGVKYPIAISVLIVIMITLVGHAFTNSSRIQRIRSFNLEQRHIWGQIRNTFNYLLTESPQGSAQGSQRQRLQASLRNYLENDHQISKNVYEEIRKLEMFCWIFVLTCERTDQVKRNSIDPDLILLLEKLAVAPDSLIDAGSSVWDSSLVISLESENALEPLRKREAILSEMHQRNVYKISILFSTVSILSLALIWWAWLWVVRPAFKQIESNRRQLIAILDSIGEGVVATDQDNRLLSANRRADHFFLDKQQQPPVGTEISDLIVPVDESESITTLINESHFRTNSRAEIKTELKIGAAEKLLATIVASPIIDAKNRFVGSVLVLRDTSREDYLKKQLQRADRLRTIDMLIGGIAHDFNNLLAGISASVEIIDIHYGRKLPKQGQDLLATITRQTRRASDLTEKLTSFSGKHTKTYSLIDMQRLIADVHGIVKRTAGKSVKIDLSDDIPRSFVLGIEGLLQSAIINLCINAVYAVDQTSGYIRIQTSIKQLDRRACDNFPEFKLKPGSFLVIDIIDNGPGVPEAYIDKIFDPFYTTKPTGEGSGLGLSAAYGTVRDHNGRIYVENRKEGGTKFSISLPTSDDIIVGKGDIFSDQAKSSQKLRPRRSSDTLSVLVIEDEQDQRNAYARMFELLGYSATTAENGKQACEILIEKGGYFSTILVDINMPEMDGVDFCLAARELNANQDIIVMSGFAEPDRLKKLSEADSIQFLKKPFGFDELRDKLDGV